MKYNFRISIQIYGINFYFHVTSECEGLLSLIKVSEDGLTVGTGLRNESIQ